MIYHQAFGGYVGRHRDNGLVQNGKGCRTGNTKDEFTILQYRRYHGFHNI